MNNTKLLTEIMKKHEIPLRGGSHPRYFSVTPTLIKALKILDKHDIMRFQELHRMTTGGDSGSFCQALQKWARLGFVKRLELKKYYEVHYMLTFHGRTLLRAVEHLEK